MFKNLLFSILISSISISLTAQSAWTLVNENQLNYFSSIYALSKEKVLATSDNGNIFQSSDGAQSMQAFQIQSKYSFLTDIKFLNAQKGWISGGCYFPFDECLPNLIVSTQDGGDSWQSESISDDLGVIIQLSVLPNGVVYAISDYAGLFRLDPQTDIWSFIGFPGTVPPYNYVGVQFFDLDHGLVERSSYSNGSYINELLRTLDGGLSWQLVSQNLLSPQDNRSYYFLDLQTGFQLTKNGLLGRTSDGGTNWAYEQIFDAEESLQKMEFVNPETGYLSTWQANTQTGRLYRSTDGGNQWFLDLAVDSTTLWDFHFSDTQNGYAIGNGDKIYKRTGTVSAQSPLAETSIQLYPNPANNFITVRIPEGEFHKSLIIRDLLGQELRVVELSSDQKVISISTEAFPPGIYTLNSTYPPYQCVKFVVHR